MAGDNPHFSEEYDAMDTISCEYNYIAVLSFEFDSINCRDFMNTKRAIQNVLSRIVVQFVAR